MDGCTDKTDGKQQPGDTATHTLENEQVRDVRGSSQFSSQDRVSFTKLLRLHTGLSSQRPESLKLGINYTHAIRQQV